MREEKIHKIEVHVATMCFNDKKEVLIAKRSPERSLYPNIWACGGGLVWPGENFEDAIKREAKDELGVIVDIIGASGTYEIPIPDSEQKKIPGIKFACMVLSFVNGKDPQISKEHSEWRWISINELDDFNFIPGVRQDILEAAEYIEVMKC